MMSSILAILFFFSVALESAVIHSFPQPFSAFPLLFLCGVLIMQRVELGLGVAWMILAGVFAQPWGDSGVAILPFAAAGLAGIPLVTKVFTNRSLYALLGLGMVLYTVAFGVVLVQDIFISLPQGFFADRLREGLFLFIGLYVGGMLTRKLRRWSQQTFFFRT